MAYALPDIPIKPKLFKYRLDTKKAYQYELSSVELNADHAIHVDYNMGVAFDFVDRDAYLLKPTPYEGPVKSERWPVDDKASSSVKQDELDQLRQTLLTEKDKFLLSEKNTFDSPVKRQQQ